MIISNMDLIGTIKEQMAEAVKVKQALLSDEALMEKIAQVADVMVNAYKSGHKTLWAGNGGSAADAQHMAGELVNKFSFDRPGLAALSLSTDTSIITSVGNDYGFDRLFARQIEAFEKVPDIQLGPSASPYQSITRDALTVFLVGRTATAIVPEDRADIRRTLQKSYPEVSIISPKEKEAFLARYRESRSGTYVYRTVPELTTWYLQDGKSLVSPSTFVAPGMPPLQERRRHLREFQKLRSFCMEAQRAKRPPREYPPRMTGSWLKRCSSSGIKDVNI